MTEPANFTSITLTPDELSMMIECVSARSIFYTKMFEQESDDFVRDQFWARSQECDHLYNLLEGEDSD